MRNVKTIGCALLACALVAPAAGQEPAVDRGPRREALIARIETALDGLEGGR